MVLAVTVTILALCRVSVPTTVRSPQATSTATETDSWTSNEPVDADGSARIDGKGVVQDVQSTLHRKASVHLEASWCFHGLTNVVTNAHGVFSSGRPWA